MEKKILQINAVYAKGSTGLVVQDLDVLIRNNGFLSYVASPFFHSPAENSYKIGNYIDHKIHALSARFSGKQAYNSIIATHKLLCWIDKIKPDIIHLHNLHNNYVNLNMLLKYLAKKDITTVITLHDCWFFTGKCYHFISADCAKWKTCCGNCPLNKEDIPSLFFDATRTVFLDKKKYLNLIPDLTIIGVSKWIAGVAKDSFLASKEIRTIYNGIDTEVFTVYPEERRQLREKLGIQNAYVILGFANKWLSSCSAETFAYITKQLSKDVMMLLVGCNETQRSNLPSNVIAIEYLTDRRELAYYYNVADVFVNVTKEDSLPTVNMEAIACGTPVITYNSGGSPELVVPEAGAVVPYGDYESLWNAVSDMRTKDRSALRDACRNYSKEHFDNKQCYHQYIDLYAEILNRKG